MSAQDRFSNVKPFHMFTRGMFSNI